MSGNEAGVNAGRLVAKLTERLSAATTQNAVLEVQLEQVTEELRELRRAAAEASESEPPPE